MHDHASYYFKSKLNIFQLAFTKFKFTVMNLVMCLEFVKPLFCFQCQADAIYFDLSSAFDLFFCMHLLLHKLCDMDCLLLMLNWFSS
jgi:hypothetical protein